VGTTSEGAMREAISRAVNITALLRWQLPGNGRAAFLVPQDRERIRSGRKRDSR
jgi:hypothetical protein